MPDPMFVREDDERELYSLYMRMSNLSNELSEVKAERDELQRALRNIAHEVAYAVSNPSEAPDAYIMYHALEQIAILAKAKEAEHGLTDRGAALQTDEHLEQRR